MLGLRRRCQGKGQATRRPKENKHEEAENSKEDVMVVKTTEGDGFLQVHLVEAPAGSSERHEKRSSSLPMRMVLDLLNQFERKSRPENRCLEYLHLLRKSVQDRPDVMIVGLRPSSHDDGLSQTWLEALTALQELGKDSDEKKICVNLILLRLLYAVMGIASALKRLEEAGAAVVAAEQKGQTPVIMNEKNLHLDCEKHVQGLFESTCRTVVMNVWRPVLLWSPVVLLHKENDKRVDDASGGADAGDAGPIAGRSFRHQLLQSTQDVHLALQRLEATFHIYHQRHVGPWLELQKARRSTATSTGSFWRSKTRAGAWTSWGIGCCLLWVVSSSAALPSSWPLVAAIVACATGTVAEANFINNRGAFSPKTDPLEEYPHKLEKVAADLEHFRTLYQVIVNDLGLVLAS